MKSRSDIAKIGKNETQTKIYLKTRRLCLKEKIHIEKYHRYEISTYLKVDNTCAENFKNGHEIVPYFRLISRAQLVIAAPNVVI